MRFVCCDDFGACKKVVVVDLLMRFGMYLKTVITVKVRIRRKVVVEQTTIPKQKLRLEERERRGEDLRVYIYARRFGILGSRSNQNHHRRITTTAWTPSAP